MKNTSKILALVLIVMTVLMSLSVISVSAEEPKTETVTKVFESKDLEAKAQGSYSDGEEVKAGTDNFFILYMSAKTKVDSSSKTWGTEGEENYYKSGQRLNFGGASTTSKQVISITTEYAATVKIWWVCGGDGNRYIAIWDADKNEIDTTEKEVANGTIGIDTLNIPAAGSYYIACPVNNNYIYKIEVSWTVQLADSDTCEHEYEHATCESPEKCSKCGKTQGEKLGHDYQDVAEVPATCMVDGATAHTKCSRCPSEVGKETISAKGHTYTFTVVPTTATTPGSVKGVCSVEGCGATFESGEIKAMTPGTYEMDASDLADIATKTLSDGYVKVVDGVFACHLSYKYKTDSNSRVLEVLDHPWDGWKPEYRMNLQSASEILENGTIKNFVQIVTTGTTTITIVWAPSNAGRELAIYDMDGNPIEGAITSINAEAGSKDTLVLSQFTLPAGAYLIGNYIPEGVGEGGSYIHRIQVVVACDHEWADATCEAPKTCSKCEATEGEALEHTYVDGKCSACEAADPNYQPPAEEPKDEPKDEPKAEPELNFFQKIIAWFMELIQKILAIFKK